MAWQDITTARSENIKYLASGASKIMKSCLNYPTFNQGYVHCLSAGPPQWTTQSTHLGTAFTPDPIPDSTQPFFLSVRGFGTSGWGSNIRWKLNVDLSRGS